MEKDSRKIGCAQLTRATTLGWCIHGSTYTWSRSRWTRMSAHATDYTTRGHYLFIVVFSYYNSSPQKDIETENTDMCIFLLYTLAHIAFGASPNHVV